MFSFFTILTIDPSVEDRKILNFSTIFYLKCQNHDAVILLVLKYSGTFLSEFSNAENAWIRLHCLHFSEIK